MLFSHTKVPITHKRQSSWLHGLMRRYAVPLQRRSAPPGGTFRGGCACILPQLLFEEVASAQLPDFCIGLLWEEDAVCVREWLKQALRTGQPEMMAKNRERLEHTGGERSSRGSKKLRKGRTQDGGHLVRNRNGTL